MWSIATATLTFSEIGLWLGIGLWSLLVVSAGGITLAALREHRTASLTPAVQKSRALEYQQAA
jgi:hypothetical protein